MTGINYITRDLIMSTGVSILTDYSPRLGGVDPEGHVLRIDASTARRARFPHAAEIVLTVERATAIRDALDEYIADEAEKTRVDYPAIAATFQPGDYALVSDNPGTKADGGGYVAPAFNGRAVTVVSREDADDVVFQDRDDLVPVTLGYGAVNYIHPAHLTRAVAVPA